MSRRVGSRSGYFAVPRAVWHEGAPATPRSRSHKFSTLEAWLDLVALAAWAPHTGSAARAGQHAGHGRAAAQLERGEFSASVRVLAQRWTWGIATVDRYLRRLRDAGEIIQVVQRPDAHEAPLETLSQPERVAERVSDRRLVVYRIANYDTYGGKAMPSEQPSGTSVGTSGPAVRIEKKNAHDQKQTPARRGRTASIAAAISDQSDLFGGTLVKTRGKARPASYVQRAADLWREHRGEPPYKVIGAALKQVVKAMEGDEERALAAFARFCMRSTAGPGFFPGNWRRYDAAPQTYTYAGTAARSAANDAALARLDRVAGLNS